MSDPKKSSRRLAATVAAALGAMAAFVRFALRGYDVLALILVGVACLVLLHAFVGGLAFKIAAGIALALALAVCVTDIPIVSATQTTAGEDTRYLVVLGARVDQTGQPSYSLRYRLESTLDFLDAHPDTIAVLSGGQGTDEPTTEARCMYDWLTERGVDPSRLIMEENATDTSENLEYSFALIRARGDEPSGCTAVVTSSYHLFRAGLMARNMGVDICGVSSYPGNPFVTLNYYIREAAAVWKVLLMGK